MPYLNKEKANLYSKNYKLDKYERLSVDVKKGEKEKLKEIAKNAGMSLNEFVNQAIKEKIERM